MRGLAGRIGLNLAVVIVVSMVVLAAAGFELLGLLGREGRIVSVELSASGGVQAGQPVTVRGTSVGSVERTSLTEEGVRLDLRLRPGSRVPRHAVVRVLRRSPIGEQAVELTPVAPDHEPGGEVAVATDAGSATRPEASPDEGAPGDGEGGAADDAARDAGDEGPPLIGAADWAALAPGEELDVRGERLPASVPEVLRLGQRLLQTVDAQALATVTSELGTALDGRADRLRSLALDGADVAETVVDASDEIERLLDVSGPTLRTIDEQREEIRAGLASSADLLDVLAARGDDVDELLAAAPGAAGEAERLLDEQAPNLSCINDDLLRLSQDLAEPGQLDALARLLDLQRFFYGSFDAGTQWDPYRPGTLWARVNLLLAELASTPPAAPKEPRTPTPPTLPGAACESPHGPGVDAVRQADPEAPDPTSPGIEYAPRVDGAGDRADHDALLP